MRIEILGRPGELSAHPGDAFDALADAAEADGADRDDWIEKALVRAGAQERSVKVTRDPAYQVITDVADQAEGLFNAAMVSAREAIRARLEQAARDADVQEYRDHVK